MDDLRELQRWMLSACTSGGPVVGASSAVRGSTVLPAATRLGIYSRGYAARLQAVLRARYPLLRNLTGDEVFDLFAVAFIQARPPVSYSLLDYGSGFAEFLDETAPPGVVASLPAAVARLDVINTASPARTP